MSRADSVGSDGVSIVVPTRDRPELLDSCLASIQQAIRAGDEVLVVDSASRDAGAVAAIAARYGARLVRCERPGVGRARNAGWRAASHPVVLFTDDDVQVDAGWRDAMAECFRADPTSAFVTGRVSAPPSQENSLQVAVKDDLEPMVLTADTRAMFGHSANLGVLRSALAAIDGWDEAMGAGGRFRAAPEGDLFDRLLAAGYRGRYEPAARAWHEQWRRVREVVRLDYGYGIGSGARMAKLLRTDRRRLRTVAAEYLWGWGVRPLPGYVLRRDWARAACTASRMLGYLVGFARAIRVPVVNGHYAESSS